MVVTRGHLTGDSLEMGVLGHLTYGLPVIESKELVLFELGIVDNVILPLNIVVEVNVESSIVDEMSFKLMV